MDRNVLIVVVTYNGMRWLSRCLKSTKNYSVIVVDNNSTDGSVDYIKSNHPKTILFEQKENIGFGQANNFGISYAIEQGANYVFLLNQDAYLEPGCIEKLIQVHQQNLGYGILSPLHLNGSGNRLDQNFSSYLSYDCNPDFYSDYVLNKPKAIIYPVPFVNAAAWLISRACIEKVGGFDPIFFHYGEDDNYCQRTRYHGFKVGVCPSAKILHDRENRKRNKIDPSSNEYLLILARRYKANYANINHPYNKELLKKASQSNKYSIKNWAKLNLSRAIYFGKEREMFRLIHKEIVTSRIINKEAGRHYLSQAIKPNF